MFAGVAAVPSMFLRYTECKESSSVLDRNAIHDVAVYFPKASQADLKAHLANLGIEGDIDTSRVVVRR